MIHETALGIEVRSAEPTVRELRERYDPSARHGIPAHVTVLTPFKDPELIDDELLGELRELFAGHQPFGFRLAKVARFPDTLYLAPDPAEPFIALTKAMVERWPDYPPYGGAFEEIIPHLTVAHDVAEDVLDAIGMGVRMNLPIDAYADEVFLMTGPIYAGRVAGPWREIDRFTLGR